MIISHITDYDIQALVDDQLGHEEAKEVREYIESDRKARERYEELIRQKKLLQIWWQRLA